MLGAIARMVGFFRGEKKVSAAPSEALDPKKEVAAIWFSWSFFVFACMCKLPTACWSCRWGRRRWWRVLSWYPGEGSGGRGIVFSG